MSAGFRRLFSPLRVGGVTFRNRLVIAAAFIRNSRHGRGSDRQNAPVLRPQGAGGVALSSWSPGWYPRSDVFLNDPWGSGAKRIARGCRYCPG